VSVMLSLLVVALGGNAPDIQPALDCSREQAAAASLDRPHFVEISEEVAAFCSQRFGVVIDRFIETVAKGDASMVQVGRDNIAAKLRIAASEQVIRRLEAGEAFPVPAVGTMPTSVTVAYKAYSECFLISNVRIADRFWEGDDEFEAIARSQLTEAAERMVSVGRASCPQSHARLERLFTDYLTSEEVAERDKAAYLRTLMDGLEGAAVSRLSETLWDGLKSGASNSNL
jgi:hypothetical protein